MKCIICDKCKKILEDPKQSRSIVCSRPMMVPKHHDKMASSADPRTNDIIWEKELCVECAADIETYIGTPVTP